MEGAVKNKTLTYWVLLIYSGLAFLLSLNQIFSLHLFGFHPFGYRYYFLAFYIPLVFLFYPLKATTKGESWALIVDWCLFIITTIACIYLGFHNQMSIDYGWEYRAPVVPLIFGCIVLVSALEAVRRVGGKVLFVICIFFGLYPVFADHMPAMLWGPSRSLMQTVSAHTMGLESIVGIVMRMCSDLLPGFIIFGVAMVATGGGKFFMDFASALLGTTRGGPAKVSVVASGFFGSISGSVVSNIITTGSMTIPTMKRAGYPPAFAAAVETCASTGGCFMPPIMGAAAFLIATFMNISYIEVCKGALIPAILFYAALLFQVDAFAARNKIHGLSRSELPSLASTLKTGWFYLFAFVVLIYTLIWIRIEAWAPYYATGVLLVCAMFRKETRFTLKTFAEFIIETGKLMSFIVGVLAAVGLVVGSLSITGVGNSFSRELVLLAGGNVILLLAMGTIVSFVLGMGMTVSACYIFLAVVMVPALVESGLNPLGCHLFVMYWGMLSYITPPVALGAITAAGVAGSDPIATGFRAMRLGSVVFILPYFFVFAPSLLMQGPATIVLVTFVTGLLGIYFLAAGLEGWLYGLGAIGAFSRVLIGVAGILLFVPHLQMSLIGLGAGILLYLFLYLQKRIGQPSKQKIE